MRSSRRRASRRRRTRQKREDLLKAATNAGLTYATFRNEWGVEVMQCTASGQKTMKALLEERGGSARGLVLSDEIGSRSVCSYLESSIDHNFISHLECALLYGYTLDLARSLQSKSKKARLLQSRAFIRKGTKQSKNVKVGRK